MDAKTYDLEKTKLLDTLGKDYISQLREFVRKAFEIDTSDGYNSDWESQLEELECEYLTYELQAAGRTLFNEDWPGYISSETVRDDIRRGLRVKALFAL